MWIRFELCQHLTSPVLMIRSTVTPWTRCLLRLTHTCTRGMGTRLCPGRSWMPGPTSLQTASGLRIRRHSSTESRRYERSQLRNIVYRVFCYYRFSQLLLPLWIWECGRKRQKTKRTSAQHQRLIRMSEIIVQIHERLIYEPIKSYLSPCVLMVK